MKTGCVYRIACCDHIPVHTQVIQQWTALIYSLCRVEQHTSHHLKHQSSNLVFLSLSLSSVSLLRNFLDIYLSLKSPPSPCLCPREILPRLLPESPTLIEVIFFKLLSRLSTPKSVLEKLQETDPRGHALILLCPHLTSSPVLQTVFLRMAQVHPS